VDKVIISTGLRDTFGSLAVTQLLVSGRSINLLSINLLSTAARSPNFLPLNSQTRSVAPNACHHLCIRLDTVPVSERRFDIAGSELVTQLDSFGKIHGSALKSREIASHVGNQPRPERISRPNQIDHLSTHES